jgi:hypothetical protein
MYPFPAIGTTDLLSCFVVQEMVSEERQAQDKIKTWLSQTQQASPCTFEELVPQPTIEAFIPELHGRCSRTSSRKTNKEAYKAWRWGEDMLCAFTSLLGPKASPQPEAFTAAETRMSHWMKADRADSEAWELQKAKFKAMVTQNDVQVYERLLMSPYTANPKPKEELT